MGQVVDNHGTILGGIRQKIDFALVKILKYDPNIYIDKDIKDIIFNDFLYVIDEFPDEIKSILNIIAISINSKIAPIDIIKMHDRKLYTPEQSGKIEKSKKLWEGWLLFLIYLEINNSSITNNEYTINLNVDTNASLKLLYADNEKSFSTTINHLLVSETFKSKGITHYIFTNQNGKFNPNIFSKDKLSNIVKDITNEKTILDEIAGKSSFACLHLEAINQNISTISSHENLKDSIKNKIIEVLTNAI